MSHAQTCWLNVQTGCQGNFTNCFFAFDIFHLRIACYYESGCDRCEDQQKARSRCAHWAPLNSTQKSGGFHTLLTPSGRDGFVLYIIVLQNYQKHYQLFTEKVELRQNLSLEWAKWILTPRRIFPLLLFVRHTSLNAISLTSSFYWLVIARVDPDQDPDVDVVSFCLQTALAPPFCAQVTPGKKQLVFLSRFIVIASASAGFRSSWGLFCLLNNLAQTP